jgi:hypothetical protein
MGKRIFTDTTEFFNIERGDIIQVGEKHYEVVGYAREQLFGLEDPKFWVKRVIESETGKRKLIKLAFFESFESALGGIKIRYFRDPDKEAKILELVKDDPNFMHGKSYSDSNGNNVRILDLVSGPNFSVYINSIHKNHEAYFHTVLPDVLRNLVKAFEAIRFLHVHGFKHGDIRKEHILVQRDIDNYVWIDFDYDFEAGENPFIVDLFELGNILLLAIGRGFHDLPMIEHNTSTYGDLIDRLSPEDFSLLKKWRFINLRKLYPYVPKLLNDILMHFSIASEVCYESVEEIIEDLNRCLYSVFE